MFKICIITDRHLCANPRVWKEANTLSEKGYHVTIITQFNSKEYVIRDMELLKQLNENVRYQAANDISRSNNPVTLFYKVRARAAYVLKSMFGLDSIYILNHSPMSIFKAAMRECADLYIAHVECGLIVGKRLITHGKKVAFDIEDWYSNDYILPSRPVNLLKKLEKFALEQGVYVTCPSMSMAECLRNEYRVSRPQTIYNSFPEEPYTQMEHTNDISLIWFSQTVGAGRGLEKIITTLQNIHKPLSLTLVGNISEQYRAATETLFRKCSQHRLIILPQVRHAELHALLKRHTIGLALEENFPANKNTTISNKILQYLQAGLKVLATDTMGQKEVAEKIPGAVKLISATDTTEWAKHLSQLIDNDIDPIYINSKFEEHFSWRHQERRLHQLVAGSLK